MAKKPSDPDLCSAPSCAMYKAPGSDYCFHHRSMYPAKREKEVKTVDKFNPQGFKSQVELFKYKWKNSDHRCYVTGENLDKYNNPVHFLSMFAHVLSKAQGKHPEFKLYSNNIVLLAPVVHELFDKGSIGKILEFEKEHKCSFATLFELEADLFKEYVGEFSGKKRVMRNVTRMYHR